MKPYRLMLALALVIASCSSEAPPPEEASGGEPGTDSGGAGGGHKSGGAGGAKNGAGGASSGGAPAAGGSGAPDNGGGGGNGQPDAAADTVSGAGGGAGGGGEPAAGALETVEVPSSGAAVAMKTSLDMGEIFLLKATGTVTAGGQTIDAEYASGAGMPADAIGALDVGVDIGLQQIHPKVHTTATPPGPERMKWSLTIGYREDHVYYMTVTGAGQPLSLKLARPDGAATGAITVSLVRLSPALAPAVGAELETVMVPFPKTVVMSTKTTELGKPYLLQASGTGKVGNGAGALGDAEYMDFDAAGTRYNEGEGGADFGVGVDEIVVGLQPRGPGGYKPRLRWWGPWRKDHTYYMVFIGTGKPIQFLYFDSGYGDNGPNDKIAVKLFAAP